MKTILKSILIALTFLFAAPAVNAQTNTDEVVYSAVEQTAVFPGGDAAMLSWLSQNIRYPAKAAEDGITGRVIVQFVVEKDGSITNVSILRGVDKELDREAVRVIRIMPQWQPAKNNGQAVRSYFTLPVSFKL